ncbi:MAG: hypothetical protein U9Q92_04835 [archaeon]|nr:hypothetical protein [archaeon]
MVKKRSVKSAKIARAKAVPKSEKENAPLVRREIFNMETLNVLLSAIILVVLLYFIGGVGADNSAEAQASSAPKFVSDEDACRIFCEYNPQYGEGSFGGVSENGHCLCKIVLDSIPNYGKNKTMSATLLVDQGIIIEDASLEDGVQQQMALPLMQ